MSLLHGAPERNKSTHSVHDHTAPGCRACWFNAEKLKLEGKLVVPTDDQGKERYSVSTALSALRKQGENGRKLVKSITRMAAGKFSSRAQFHGIIAALLVVKDSHVREPLIASWVKAASKVWNKLKDTPKEEMEH